MTLGCIMGTSAKRVKKSGVNNVNLKRQEARLDSVMQSHYDPQSPGAALLIAKNGKAIYDKGIGIADMATGEKIDGNTAFNIASISKQFTAIGALKMQEMGLINLNNSVASYFPELQRDIWHKIKLKHRDVKNIYSSKLMNGLIVIIRAGIGHSSLCLIIRTHTNRDTSRCEDNALLHTKVGGCRTRPKDAYAIAIDDICRTIELHIGNGHIAIKQYVPDQPFRRTL